MTADSNDIRLISDGNGLAIVGEQEAVEAFLRSNGLWGPSQNFDLRRLRSLIALSSDLTQAASEFSANSGRWIKLTKESARLVKENGLIQTKTPGVNHIMVGAPGKVKNWLQAEHGPGSLLTNPAALSGIAGLMAQVASQQTMAEIVSYLDRIDVKVDDVLGKVDDTVLKDMRGARFQIRRALTMRDLEGRVTPDSWSEVQNASGKLADVQGYALLQLEALARKLEDSGSVRGLAAVVEAVKPDVQKWLAVLADTFQLQEAFDVLALDKAMEESPEALNARRQGLAVDRADRLKLISGHTIDLLGRIDIAVARANKRLPLTRDKSIFVIDAGNSVATDVHNFHELLSVDEDLRAWAPRHLGKVAEAGSRALQKTKDAGPPVVATVGILGLAAFGAKGRGSGQS